MISKHKIIFIVATGVVVGFLSIYINALVLFVAAPVFGRVLLLFKANSLLGYIFFKMFFELSDAFCSLIGTFLIGLFVKDIKFKYLGAFWAAFFLLQFVSYYLSFDVQYKSLINIRTILTTSINAMIVVLLGIIGWKLAAIAKRGRI